MQLGWVNSPDPNLVAEVEYGPFEYPPGLVDSLPSEARQSFSYISGYWSITLRNEGKKPGKHVKLWLDNLVYVRIYRDNEELVSNGSLEPIEIGDLHPPEEIKITAWSSSEPSFYVADDIRLTHNSGTGTVLIRAPIDPVWHKLERSWRIILIFIIIFTIVPLIAYILDKLGLL